MEDGRRCGCNYLNIRRRRRASSWNISQLAPYYASNLRPAIRARCFWEVQMDEYLREEPTSSDFSVPRLRFVSRGHVQRWSGDRTHSSGDVLCGGGVSVVGEQLRGWGKRRWLLCPILMSRSSISVVLSSRVGRAKSIG